MATSPERIPESFVSLIRSIHERSDLQLVRTADAEFVAAIDDARARGFVPSARAFHDTWREVAGFHYGALEVPFAKRWNRLSPDVVVDLDAVVEMRRSGYREELERLRAEVQRNDLSAVFTDEWFERISRVLAAWDGEGILSSRHCVTFFRMISHRIEGKSLVEKIRQLTDQLMANSPKKNLVKQRIRSLAAEDAENTVGALFEMTVLLPLFSSGSRLLEFQPLIPNSTSRAEALMEIGGQAIYVEATTFTKYDKRILEPRAFDPVAEREHGAARVAAKVREKAAQLDGADRPVVLFVALAIDIEMGAAKDGISEVITSGAVDNLSAIVVARDIEASTIYLYDIPSARYPLSSPARDLIQLSFADSS